MCKSPHSSLALVLFALKHFFHSREKQLFYCGCGFYFLLWLHSILITPLIAVTEKPCKKKYQVRKSSFNIKVQGKMLLGQEVVVADFEKKVTLPDYQGAQSCGCSGSSHSALFIQSGNPVNEWCPSHQGKSSLFN